MNSQQPITIIAGPCSVQNDNIEDIYQIASIEVRDPGSNEWHLAIYGTRVVGLKSRTAEDTSGNGMGMDYEAFVQNQNILIDGGSHKDFVIMPSMEIARKVAEETGFIIATEIMEPHIQLPLLERYLGKERVFPWNPSVDQLGWHLKAIAAYAQRNNWKVGIKNGKWLGDVKLDIVQSEDFDTPTGLEQTWSGLVSYVGGPEQAILIHRGIDVAGKGEYRNVPVHLVAQRTKIATKAKLYFDPSHTFGPKLRSQIVRGTIDAMQLKMPDGSYLYDGILIEAGHSETDSGQHITINELEILCQKLVEIRLLDYRKRVKAVDTKIH